MDDAYLGTIFIWAGSFLPDGYQYCNGASLTVNQNTALFSVIGNVFGGDGKNNFLLPDLRGRIPVGSISMGTASWMTNPAIYAIGKALGNETSTLTTANLPPHNHALPNNTALTGTLTGTASVTISSISASGKLKATAQLGSTSTPGTNAVPAKIPTLVGTGDDVLAYGTPDNTTTMPVDVTVTPPSGGLNVDLSKVTTNVPIGIVGSGQAFSNLQPYLALNYIIATQGLYPPRNN
jgi:microcystin-dependent protein